MGRSHCSFPLRFSRSLFISDSIVRRYSAGASPATPAGPPSHAWEQLNASLAGHLISTKPIGSMCHNNTDFAECSELRSRWTSPATHYEDSSSPLAAYWSNFSCSPFQHAGDDCMIGPLAQYTTNVTSAADVQKGMITSEDRLLLSLSRYGCTTSNSPSIDRNTPTSTWYTGPALRIGAGVQGHEAQEAAHNSEPGHFIMYGHSPDISIAGGYTQGGGHGPLASKYGLAADQVLEWKVVTTAGEILTASPEQNSDLYWALSGGGGGTYGVVLSMTVRMYPEEQTASASLVFPFDAADSRAWDVIRSFISGTLLLIHAGGTALWVLYPGPTVEDPVTLIARPLTLPGITKDVLQAYLA
ncbi:hypothetical protein BJX66DRAFT_339377 [Aspergillus keveii]|uniref:FAD-binding PCMH-type domain-containing protein n=1 Tax=Aspergillus keveii TaxID=714993 RepID=A0ABR4G2E2_9EURO